MNAGYMAKLVWHFLSDPDSLWTRVLRFKYIKDNSSYAFLSRSYLSVIDDTKCALSWALGNGKNVKFQSDYWLDIEGPLINFVSSDTLMNFEDITVADMIQERQWDTTKFSHLLSTEVNNKILAFYPPSGDNKDIPIWNLTTIWKFALNSAIEWPKPNVSLSDKQ